jgi:hypothetical protein
MTDLQFVALTMTIWIAPTVDPKVARFVGVLFGVVGLATVAAKRWLN